MRKKILILRFSSIGDIVLTTPIVRCLKTQLPEAEIHYATKKQYEPLLLSNPHIDKIHVLNDSLKDLVKQLHKEQFDFIADLHYNFRTWKIKRRLNVKSSSFYKLNIEKWLLVNFKINKLPPKHIVDRYLETCQELGVINDGKGLDFFIPVQDMVDIKSFPQNFLNGFIAVVIGARHFTKKLPNEKLIALCAKIAQPIILVGGKEDFDNGEIIRQSNTKEIFNACGKYSINQSASIIQQSDKVFSHDTGMMHIAAAFQKKIISIWGNTVPEFGMYPYYGNKLSLPEQRSQHKILEVLHLSCRPCSKIGFNKCPRGHFKCMKDIDFSNIQT